MLQMGIRPELGFVGNQAIQQIDSIACFESQKIFSLICTAFAIELLEATSFVLETCRF